MNKILLKKISIATVLLALGWVLPFVTMGIPEFGNMLCPMHIPVFLTGMILGPIYGALIGFITPLTRSIIFLAPKLYPNAISMSFELLAYGLFSGLLFKFLFKKTNNQTLSLYISLILSMIIGRIIWAITRIIMLEFLKVNFSLAMFLSVGFINAWPGIVLQLILIPTIILALKKAKLMNDVMI